MGLPGLTKYLNDPIVIANIASSFLVLESVKHWRSTSFHLMPPTIEAHHIYTDLEWVLLPNPTSPYCLPYIMCPPPSSLGLAGSCVSWEHRCGAPVL